MKKIHYFALFVIFCVALIYRLPHLNTPFWVDEFSSSGQANLILKYGPRVFTQQESYFEHENITTYFIIAFFFKFFGASTTTARLPSVFIGALVPVLVWLLTQQQFKDKRISYAASILTLLSYAEITWSRQARGYVLQQDFLLLTLLLYFQLLKTKKKKHIFMLCILLGVTAIFGFLTHVIYFVLLGAIMTHLAYFYRRNFLKAIKNPLSWLFIFLVGVIVVVTGTVKQMNGTFVFLSQHGLNNNFWYYHSLLWRQYGLVLFLGLFGWVVAFLRKHIAASLFFLYFMFYLFFFVFLFNPYTSRYMLSLFPLLFIGVAYAFGVLSDVLLKELPQKRKLYLLLPLLLTFAVVINGDKFVLKPHSFYSVNHDQRDIALVDYDEVYNLIKQKGDLQQGQTVVIDTWPDRARWYLGSEFQPLYEYHWAFAPGLVNGLEMRTLFATYPDGEKYLPKTGGVRFVSELSDLQRVMKKYPKGFLWIDDASLPKDVMDYAEKNLKKELFVNHYPLDDNPFSIWPATLYSWGIN